MTTGYEGAIDSRERNDISIYRSMPGYEENVFNAYDRANVIARLRDMYRNNELARGVVDRFADYVVHTGIRPQAQTTSRDWNEEAEDYHNRWGQVCDYQHRAGVTLNRMQRQCILDRMIQGESLFLLMESGHLYPLDPDRLATPAKLKENKNIHQGIKANSDGVVSGYYICRQKVNGAVNSEEWDFYPREDIVHCVWPWRVASQWRGVPELAATMNRLQDFRETDKYQLLKAKNDAMQFLKHTKDGGHGLINSVPRGMTRRDDGAGGQTVVEKHDWGMKWNLAVGEDVNSFESRTPNSQYVPYLEFQAQTIGAALGLPWEFVMMIFTKGSFSAQRSALLHALHKFIQWHSDLSTQFCQRIWNWRIAKAIKAGELDRAPVDKHGVSEWYKVDWSLPNMGWVDPEHMIDADIKAWAFGKTSLKEIASAQGKDREEMLDEKGRDIIEAARVAADANRANPELKLTWRDIIDPKMRGEQRTELAQKENEINETA